MSQRKELKNPSAGQEDTIPQRERKRTRTDDDSPQPNNKSKKSELPGFFTPPIAPISKSLIEPEGESSSDYISSESSYVPSAHNSDLSHESSDEPSDNSDEQPSKGLKWGQHRLPSQEVIDFHKKRTPARSVLSLGLLNPESTHGPILRVPQKDKKLPSNLPVSPRKK